jgi:PKD repeat protein
VDSKGYVYVTGHTTGATSDFLTVKYWQDLPIEILTENLPEGDVGVAYNASFEAMGGVEPYSWAIVNGVFPAGLIVNSTTGDIYGTPTTGGTSVFTAQVTGTGNDIATKQLSITINELVITTTSLPYATVGTGYVQGLSASGGVAPYSWAIVNGVLPDGLSLDGPTGVISGTPTTPGAFDFTALVTDTNLDSATKDLSISVYDPLGITTSSLSYGVTGRAYSDSLAATGGLEPYSWAITNSTLPNGLILNSTTGDIYGTPTTAGVSVFTATVTDANTESDSRALSIPIYDPVAVDTVSLQYGVTGRAYSDTLSASGGLAPYSWAITNGVLPDGLALDGATGVISGTTATAGSYNFTVQATDANSETGVKDLSIAVHDPLGITTTDLSYGVTGRAYSDSLAATGGLEPYSWAITNSTLPNGLILNSTTGDIYGTPTAAGTSNLTVQVMDANTESDSRALSIPIYDPVAVDTVSLPYGVTGRAYAQTLSASGGVSPYTWSIASGSLPDGLTLDGATGAISGTPTTVGSYNFTVQATDDIGETGSRALTIAVYDPASISTTSLPNGEVGTAYNEVLTATGGLTPYSWSITAGSLPDGLSLDSAAGVISGTPTTSGISDFTVGVTDANLETASQDLSITVGKTTTYYILTASNCNAEVYARGPQYAQLGTASGDCTVGDTLRWKFKGGPRDMLVGYLANGGYASNTAVTGAAMGNDLSFFINGSDGIGYVHLVEVNPSDGTVIQVLSTVSVSISPDTLTSVTNISALSGTVSAGNTVGIVLSIASTERDFSEITWGTTGGGPGLEQWFTVTETPLGSSPPPANNPPVAAANGPYNGTVDTPVSFSSSGSDDPDGDAITYLWDFGDSNTSTEANPTHTYTTADTFTVTLTVTDTSSASDTDTTTATITTGTNQPPVAAAGPDKTAQVREVVAFDGSGSYDPDGSIASYDWDFGDDKTGSGVTVSHDYKKAGTYTVTLTVTDNEGATAQDTAVVTVSK